MFDETSGKRIISSLTRVPLEYKKIDKQIGRKTIFFHINILAFNFNASYKARSRTVGEGNGTHHRAGNVVNLECFFTFRIFYYCIIHELQIRGKFSLWIGHSSPS